MIGARGIGDRTRFGGWLALAATIAAGGFTASADAQATQSVSQSIAATEYPAAFIARPINLRGGMVRIDTRYQHGESQVAGARSYGNQLAIGAAVGLTDSIEIGITHVRPNGLDYYNEGAVVGNLNGRSFGDVAIYGRYAFLDAQDFKISGEIGVVLPTHTSSAWQFEFGLPVRARLGEHFALDLLPEIRIAVPHSGSAATADLALNVPVAGVLQFNNHLWLAGRSGMYWTNFKLDGFYFPAILELGGTIDHAGKAVLDVAVQGGFPYLFVPGATDAVRTDIWVMRLNVTGYLDF